MKLEEDANQLRPSLMQIETELVHVKKGVWIVSLLVTFFYIIIWPVVSVSFGDFSLVVFRFWIIIGHVFIAILLAYFLIAPLVESYFLKILSAAKRSRQFFKGLKKASNKKNLVTDYFTYRQERKQRAGSVDSSES